MPTDHGGHRAGDWRRSPAIAARRHWKAILLVTLVAVGVGVLLSLSKDATYSASAKVLVKNFQSLSEELAGGGSDRLDPNRVVTTQAELVTLPVVAQRVQRALDLPASDAERIREATSVETDATSDLLTITTENTNPALSVQLANAFAQEFVRYRGEIDTAALVAARKDVVTQLNALAASGRTDSPFYGQLLRTQQDLRGRILLGSRNSSVVQDAEEAVQTGPEPIRVGLIGGFAGLVIGVIAAWLIQLLDRRVSVEADAARAFGHPPLARIPPIPRRVARTGGLVTLLEPTSPASEAFRRLAMMLEMTIMNGSRQVIVVASAAPSEGKTTTILNLAVTLAETGKRVAVCDCDLRAASVAQRLNLPNEIGLTEVLTRQLPLSGALHRGLTLRQPLATNGSEDWVESRPITVLTSGRAPSNPGELLGGERLGKTLAALRRGHEIVLVDTPAWSAASDALAVSRGADGILCIVKQGATALPSLAQLAEGLGAAPAPLVGYVLVNWKVQDGEPYGRRYESYPSAHAATIPPDETAGARRQ